MMVIKNALQKGKHETNSNHLTCVTIYNKIVDESMIDLSTM